MPQTASISAYRPEQFSTEEWELRVKLAACYRIFDYMGWTELVFNHISLRLPGPDHHFLINPYGLWYDEITASNLLKIDLDGNIIGASEYPFNKAGFIIHGAIHAARDDAHCVMHTHTTATSAVACQEGGLHTDNFYTAFIHGDVTYHDFEGLTVFADEQKRLVASLGDKSIMLLRNHGSLTVGRSVAEAFMNMWTLQRACEIQLAAHANGASVIPVSAQAIANSQAGRDDDGAGRASEEMVFDALIRKIDAIDTSYKT